MFHLHLHLHLLLCSVPLPDPEVLQQVKIPIIPHRVCEKHHPGLTPQQLCAGDMAGGKDACEVSSSV